jgi:hypothetical protein
LGTLLVAFLFLRTVSNGLARGWRPGNLFFAGEGPELACVPRRPENNAHQCMHPFIPF